MRVCLLLRPDDARRDNPASGLRGRQESRTTEGIYCGRSCAAQSCYRMPTMAWFSRYLLHSLILWTWSVGLKMRNGEKAWYLRRFSVRGTIRQEVSICSMFPVIILQEYIHLEDGEDLGRRVLKIGQDLRCKLQVLRRLALGGAERCSADRALVMREV